MIKKAVIHPCPKKKKLKETCNVYTKNNIPEFSSVLSMSDFLKVYPMKLVSVDVSICKSHINRRINIIIPQYLFLPKNEKIKSTTIQILHC